MEMSNAQKVEWLVETLRLVQFRGPTVVTPHHRREGTCPFCFGYPEHKTDCRILQALGMKPTAEAKNETAA